MNKQHCDHCGRSATEGHLHHCTSSGKTLCMCCMFVREHARPHVDDGCIPVKRPSPWQHELWTIYTGLVRVSVFRSDEERAALVARLIGMTRSLAESLGDFEQGVALAAHAPQRSDAQAPLVVYLACPYSHESEDVRRSRFIQASVASAWLMRRGYGVISPISMGHPIGKYGKAAGDWGAWQPVCLRMIDACDAVVVLNTSALANEIKGKMRHAEMMETASRLSVLYDLERLKHSHEKYRANRIPF